jgi:small subunit ribosomal protein S16
MAVKIRLMRMGKKKQPTYRVVVADSRSPRDGRIIESIGRYDPRQEPSVVEVDNDRALHWLGVGAQPTERAQKLLEISGAWARFKIARGEIYTVPDRPVKVAEEPSTEEQAEAAPGADATEGAAEASAEVPGAAAEGTDGGPESGDDSAGEEE